MKKLILPLVAAVGIATAAQASDLTVALDKAPVDLSNQTSLQNGAKLFVDYCLSCHSAAFMRYNRLQDIGFTEQDIKDRLLFASDKVGETMIAAINPKEAKDWFGANPPDLTVIARATAGNGGSGADYLYTFLRSFYVDEGKGTGWNNTVFPSVGMPNPLWELQGLRHASFDGETFKGWEQLSPGKMSEQEFNQTVGDLVNYLQWMGEPAQQSRKTIGTFVLAFLAIFIFIAWRLSASFWKEVK